MSIKAIEDLPVTAKAIQRAKSLYFDPVDARQLVLECGEHNLAVIGIEGLTLGDDWIRPDLDLIADHTALETNWSGYVWSEFLEICNRSALEFLEFAENAKKNGRLVFDFVLMRSDEFKRFQREHEEQRRLRSIRGVRP
jgi:hypothetical protein